MKTNFKEDNISCPDCASKRLSKVTSLSIGDPLKNNATQLYILKCQDCLKSHLYKVEVQNVKEVAGFVEKETSGKTMNIPSAMY